MDSKARLCSAMIQMIENLNPIVFLTLNLGPSSAPHLTRATVEYLFQKLEHRTHGKRWADYPLHLRLRALAFLEHPDSNPHWHCVLAGPPEIIEVALELAPSLWRGLVKNGHGHVEPIENLKKTSRYVTKDLYKDWSFESFIAYGPVQRT